MAFIKNKLNELSKEELVEELLRFDNLSAKKDNPTKKWAISLQNLIVFFLSCRFPKSVIHYYANELLIWSNHG